MFWNLYHHLVWASLHQTLAIISSWWADSVPSASDLEHLALNVKELLKELYMVKLPGQDTGADIDVDGSIGKSV